MRRVIYGKHSFIEAYPLLPRELVLYPVITRMMLPEMSEFAETGMPLLLDLASFAGISDGTVRTAVSRLKTTGYLVSAADAKGASRYAFNPEKIGLIRAHMSRNLKQEGFLVAVFSFAKENEAERSAVRETLKDFGFRKLAQNTYINGWIETEGLLSAVRSMGLEKYLYLFPCRDIDDPNLLWKIGELFDIRRRIERLLKFADDYFSFVGESGLSRLETGRRMFYAGAVFWNVCMMEEPSVPARFLDASYPQSTLIRQNDEFFREHTDAFLEYYRVLNG